MTKPQLQSALPGRNDLCSCGSQKKFKKCCGRAEATPLPFAAPPRVNTASSLWATARQAFEANDLSSAQAHCERLLQLDARHAEAWHLCALIAFRRNEYAAALPYVQQAIKIAPRVSSFYNSLGFIQKELGEWNEAEQAYRKALQLDPSNALALYNLGEMFATGGKNAEAERHYRDALRCLPDFHEAHNNLGLLLFESQQYDQAVIHLVQAIRLRPQETKVYLGLARALSKLGRFAEVQAVMQEAVRLQPDLADAWHYLGLSLNRQGDITGAITAYQTAVEINPQLCESHLNLGSIYFERGMAEMALHHFTQAEAVRPTDGLKMRKVLCVPAFYDSIEQSQTVRENLIADLDRLMEEPLQIKTPDEEVALSTFFLAYQNENQVGLLSRIGDLLLKSCPALGEVAPHCLEPKSTQNKAGERVDIGFISACFGKPNHIVNRVMAGIIANWPRDRYRVTVLHAGNLSSELMPALREGDRILSLPMNWERAKQQIAEAQLDILFYSDLGMDYWTYFLSFARLAPIQLVTAGHPITSGVPNIDFYLSSANDELPYAQEHYRERLIQLPERPVSFMPAPTQRQARARADFGLSEHRHVYVCPMTPFKLHPAQDALFGEILRTDVEGELVFVVNHQTELWERLKQRFARTIPDVVERIRYLPFMPLTDLAELLRLSDVMLDTVVFNGGTTSLESLAVGTPIVTLPGEYLRQRGTYALYNRIGLFDCVANNEAEYVRIATEIAQRSDHREHLRQAILSRNTLLFGQTSWIRKFSDFLLEELEARKGAA